MHVLMRDEKEGRKKQATSNKQQGKVTQHVHVYVYMYMYICNNGRLKVLFEACTDGVCAGGDGSDQCSEEGVAWETGAD